MMWRLIVNISSNILSTSTLLLSIFQISCSRYPHITKNNLSNCDKLAWRRIYISFNIFKNTVKKYFYLYQLYPLQHFGSSKSKRSADYLTMPRWPKYVHEMYYQRIYAQFWHNILTKIINMLKANTRYPCNILQWIATFIHNTSSKKFRIHWYYPTQPVQIDSVVSLVLKLRFSKSQYKPL